MRKLLFFMAIAALLLGGCGVKITPTTCNRLQHDRNAIVPKECREYNKQEAYKAFENKTNETNSTVKIQFSKDAQ
jgi:uncharacterized lipoprotein YmbA